MTPVELVTALYTAGCRLLPEGEQLRVHDPHAQGRAIEITGPGDISAREPSCRSAGHRAVRHVEPTAHRRRGPGDTRSSLALSLLHGHTALALALQRADLWDMSPTS
jgi:hypothetical protein